MRIYLSSTYTDLIDHRTAVVRVLRQMGHEAIGMESTSEGQGPSMVRRTSIPPQYILASSRGGMGSCHRHVSPGDPAGPPRGFRSLSRVPSGGRQAPSGIPARSQASWPVQHIDAPPGTPRMRRCQAAP